MINKRFTPVSRCAFAAVVAIVLLTVMAACARMGQPDGGWYDETPPRILSASPADKSVNVSSKKIYINFDEYIQIENAQEKVIVSPPQMEQPDIKSQGKRIVVQLRDTLQPNVTYTVDFSDAITDITENNPLGNYTYSFSTGAAIDTMEVAGYVVDAQNLEPVKGILVGLYANLADSAFTTLPMARVARTDATGRFVVKGVAPGSYRVYALEDADGNFLLEDGLRHRSCGAHLQAGHPPGYHLARLAPHRLHHPGRLHPFPPRRPGAPGLHHHPYRPLSGQDRLPYQILQILHHND